MGLYRLLFINENAHTKGTVRLAGTVAMRSGDSSLSTHVQTLMAGLHNETTEWLAEYETK